MATIGLLGDRNPAFLTHRELESAIDLLPAAIEAQWIGTDEPDAVERAAGVDGLWVIPGTPYRDDDAVYRAIESARTNGQPFLGTCGGFQYAAVEYARNVAGLSGATHAEVDPDGSQQIVQPLSCSLVAEEREVTVVDSTRLSEYLGTTPFVGFHYCNYGLADEYVGQLEEHGLVIAARAPDAGIEAVEIADHSFFTATLFQPQVGSIDGHPLNPLIEAFCLAAVEVRQDVQSHIQATETAQAIDR